MLTLNKRQSKQVDPTRTISMRRALVMKVRRAFGKLRARVLALVTKENAFGLTANVFCPTGRGGGIDPTCGVHHQVTKDTEKVYATTFKVDGKDFFFEAQKDHEGWHIGFGLEKNRGGDTARMTNDPNVSAIKVLGSVGLSIRQFISAKDPQKILFTAEKFDASRVIFYDRISHKIAGTAFKVEMRDYPALKEYVLTKNPTVNRWQFATDSDKVKQFETWLKAQAKDLLLSQTEEKLWEKFAKDALVKGAGRSFDDYNAARKADAELGFESDPEYFKKIAGYQGSKQQFLQDAFRQPVATDKLKTLAERSFTDLKNVTEDMATKMRRELVDGLARGEHPRDIAKSLMGVLDLSQNRAETIARTEIIRAHAEGQLLALERMGVDEVGVQVEWSTAGDDRVCPLCEELEGAVYTVEEAHGLIPKHPNCRCAFLPYFPEVGLTGEKPDEQPEAPQFDSQEKCYQILEDAKDKHQADLSELEQKHENESSELESRLNAARERAELEQNVVSDLQSQLADTEDGADMEELQSRIDDATEQLDAAQSTVSELEQGLEQLPQEQSDERQEMLDAQEEELAELQQRCDEVAELTGNIFCATGSIYSSKGELLADLKEDSVIANTFCPTGKGGGIDPHCGGAHAKDESGWGGSGGPALPQKPTFVSSQKSNVEANEKAVNEMEALAKAGKLGELMVHPATPSPKVLAYKEALISAVSAHIDAEAQAYKDKKAKEEAEDAPFIAKVSEPLPAPSDLAFVKSLPGSTNPSLMKDGNGKLWVLKQDTDPKHLQNEADTDAAYRAAGVETPNSGIIQTAKGPAKVAEFEQGETLASWQVGKSDAVIKAMYQKIGKNFVLDAVLANRDAIGLSHDNILLTDKGPMRIDNGGSLKYRAQGKLKSDFGAEVTELKTLRDPSVNPSAASVYGHLKDADIHQQIKELLPKKAKILAAITDPDTRNILKQRFDYLEKQLPKEPTKLAPAVPKQVATPTPAHPLHTGEGLVNHILKNPGNAKFTKLDLDKIKALNPDGIKGGVVNISRHHTPKEKEATDPHSNNNQAAHLQKILPEGTKIKVVWGATKKTITKQYGDETVTTTTGKATHEELHAKFPSVGAEQKVELADMKAHMKWKESLTSAEKASISYWKGGGQVSVKNAVDKLKKGEAQDADKEARAKAFMSAIERSPSHEGIAYRGVHSTYAKEQLKQIVEAGVGGTWSDNKLHGLSLSPETSKGFSGGELLFRVKTKTAKPIWKEDGYDGEREIIGMPGVQYRIVGIHANTTKGYGQPKHVVDLVEI